MGAGIIDQAADKISHGIFGLAEDGLRAVHLFASQAGLTVKDHHEGAADDNQGDEQGENLAFQRGDLGISAGVGNRIVHFGRHKIIWQEVVADSWRFAESG